MENVRKLKDIDFSTYGFKIPAYNDEFDAKKEPKVMYKPPKDEYGKVNQLLNLYLLLSTKSSMKTKDVGVNASEFLEDMIDVLNEKKLVGEEEKNDLKIKLQKTFNIDKKEVLNFDNELFIRILNIFKYYILARGGGDDDSIKIGDTPFYRVYSDESYNKLKDMGYKDYNTYDSTEVALQNEPMIKKRQQGQIRDLKESLMVGFGAYLSSVDFKDDFEILGDLYEIAQDKANGTLSTNDLKLKISELVNDCTNDFSSNIKYCELLKIDDVYIEGFLEDNPDFYESYEKVNNIDYYIDEGQRKVVQRIYAFVWELIIQLWLPVKLVFVTIFVVLGLSLKLLLIIRLCHIWIRLCH